MADVSDQRLFHAVLCQLFQCTVDRFRLIVRNHAGQNRYRYRFIRQEGHHALKTLRHQQCRRIEIAGPQFRQLRGKLLFGGNLENRYRIAFLDPALRHGRHRLVCSRFRCHSPLRKLRDQLSSQFVNLRRGQEKPVIRLRLVFYNGERSAAGFIHLFDDVPRRDALPLGPFRNRSEGHRPVSVVIKSNRLCLFSLLHQGVEVNGNTADFAVAVSASGICIKTVEILIRFRPDSMHVCFVTVQVSLRKALSGKDTFQQLHLIVCRLAFFLQNLGIHARDNPGVFRPLHPSFDFHTAHAGSFQLLEPVHQAVVFQ